MSTPRRLHLLPGVTLDRKSDPALTLVQARRQAQDRGESTPAAELRVDVNALVFGNLCRFDEVTVRRGRQWVLTERPGPLICLPIASTVSAGPHLMLAVAYRWLVGDLSGSIAYWDTDSIFILSSPEGGEIALPDGTTRRVLADAEVDGVLAMFESLSPEPDWAVWKLKRGTQNARLHALVFGPKRQCTFLDDGSGMVVDHTETALGGFFADPPRLRGRSVDGRREWTRVAAQREVDFARHGGTRAGALRPDASWDEGERLPFPALRRLQVTTPELLKSLPKSLGLRPGSRYVEALVSELRPGVGAPVALDPGGDLSDWVGLGWVDRVTDEPRQVTTDPAERDAVLLETLDARAVRWAGRPRTDPIEMVEVDPNLVQHVGPGLGGD
jgi:hypothetical protein